MPTYDFRCPTCDVTAEIKLSMSEVDNVQVHCPRCSDLMKQEFSPPNFSVPHTVGSYIDKRTKSADEVQGIKEKTEKKAKSGWQVEGGQIVHRPQIEGK